MTLVVCLTLVAGCATPRPLLDTDGRGEQAGEARARRDIDHCTAEAGGRVQSGVEVAGSVALATMAGAAAGAGLGIIHAGLPDQVGVAAAAGAIAGAVLGLISGFLLANENQAAFKGHLEACLEERGHRLEGWDHGAPEISQ